MDHTRLKPMEGVSGREKTAFTMKTIQELLAEEIAAPTPTATPAVEAAPEQPPHVAVAAEEPKPVAAKPALRTTTAAERTMPPMPLPELTKASALPPIAPADEAEAEPVSKPRSFLGRLMRS
ncbi:hypothetical protein [uncultured Litoreibacter sp.]|uniref:hypothetical protein n=1 Tax=uncultured Litoreibacter sp. TaxID=1392394 RepID=UPI00262A0B73|nr:hypothetical protein [uncultured Litoreibacter sp.]